MTFQLTVTDDAGQKASDICIVNVSGTDSAAANEAPFADAGLDQVVNAHDAVTLDGSGSADVDGLIVSYQWKQTRGPAVTLSDPTAASLTFTAPAKKRGAKLRFRLKVVDDGGLKCRDDVVVEVNAASSQSAVQPVADAGPDLIVNPGDEVTLTAAASTPADGSMTYSWRKVAGPRLKLSNRKDMETTFVAPLMGQNGGKVTFMLTVRNGRQRATDTCTVQIRGMGF
jgi:chitinase